MIHITFFITFLLSFLIKFPNNVYYNISLHSTIMVLQDFGNFFFIFCVLKLSQNWIILATFGQHCRLFEDHLGSFIFFLKTTPAKL